MHQAASITIIADLPLLICIGFAVARRAGIRTRAPDSGAANSQYRTCPYTETMIQDTHSCHGGAPVSTSDRRRGQHAGDESLAPLSIRFKTNKSKLQRVGSRCLTDSDIRGGMSDTAAGATHQAGSKAGRPRQERDSTGRSGRGMVPVPVPRLKSNHRLSM